MIYLFRKARDAVFAAHCEKGEDFKNIFNMAHAQKWFDDNGYTIKTPAGTLRKEFAVFGGIQSGALKLLTDAQDIDPITAYNEEKVCFRLVIMPVSHAVEIDYPTEVETEVVQQSSGAPNCRP